MNRTRSDPVAGGNPLVLPVLVPGHNQSVWRLTLKVWLASTMEPSRFSLVPVGGGSSTSSLPDRLTRFDLRNLLPGVKLEAVIDYPADAPTTVALTLTSTVTESPSATPRVHKPTHSIAVPPVVAVPTSALTSTVIVVPTATQSPPPTIAPGKGKEPGGGAPAATATPVAALPSMSTVPTSPTPRPRPGPQHKS